jgi:hypothetical protein
MPVLSESRIAPTRSSAQKRQASRTNRRARARRARMRLEGSVLPLPIQRGRLPTHIDRRFDVRSAIPGWREYIVDLSIVY